MSGLGDPAALALDPSLAALFNELALMEKVGSPAHAYQRLFRATHTRTKHLWAVSEHNPVPLS